MEKSKSTMAQQIAEAASAFEQLRTGHGAKSVTVVLSDVREATAEVETKTGTVVHMFTTGTLVQVFLPAHGIPADTWSGIETVNQS